MIKTSQERPFLHIDTESLRWHSNTFQLENYFSRPSLCLIVLCRFSERRLNHTVQADFPRVKQNKKFLKLLLAAGLSLLLHPCTLSGFVPQPILPIHPAQNEADIPQFSPGSNVNQTIIFPLNLTCTFTRNQPFCVILNSTHPPSITDRGGEKKKKKSNLSFSSAK